MHNMLSIAKFVCIFGSAILLVSGKLSGGTNLLSNSSFETHADKNNMPDGWFTTGKRDAVFYEKSGGKRGVCCICIADAPGEATIRQANLSLQPGQQYKLSGWMKTENFSGTGGLTVINAGWTWSSGHIRPGTPSTEWVSLARVFSPQPSANGKYQVVFYTLKSTGKIYLDDVKLEPVSAAKPVPDKESSLTPEEREKIRKQIAQIEKRSLAPNPSFINPDPSDKTRPSFWKPEIKSEPGQDSKPVLRYLPDGYLDEGAVAITTPTEKDWGEWESMPIALEPNTAYEITFWGKTDGGGAVEIIFDGVDRYVSRFPKEWNRINELFITKPDTTHSTIRLILYHRSKQTVWFDHICLNKVDITLEEPAENSTIADNSPTFRWSAPLSTISSDLEYSTDPEFSAARTITIRYLENTTYSPTETIPNGVCFWRVTAHTGVKCPELISKVSSFTVRAKKGSDTTAPRIISVTPRNVAGIKPVITATYTDNKDGSGIAAGRIKLMLDDNDITPMADITPSSLSCSLAVSLGKHNLSLSIADKAGNKDSLEWSFYSYAKEPTVKIGKDNILLVKNKPCFPLGFYSPLPDSNDFRVFKENGFNTLQLYGMLNLPQEKIKRWLDEAEKAGLMMVAGGIPTHEISKENLKARIAPYKDHPALLGFYVPDEADARGLNIKKMEQAREWAKELTPKPLMTTFCSPRRFRAYADTVGIFWTDPYPYFKFRGGTKADITKVFDQVTKACRAVKKQKPVWVNPQLFNHHPPLERMPTYWEERCMTYLGIVAGAKGVIYYAFKPSYDHVKEHPGLWEGVKALGRELSALSPVLLAMDSSEKLAVKSSLDIHYLVKKHNNSTYIIAVNASSEDGTAVFRLSGWQRERRIYVFPEGRTIPVSSGEFSDSFKTYEVHIYTDNKQLPSCDRIEDVDRRVSAADKKWWDIQKDNVALVYNGAKVTASRKAGYYGFKKEHVADGLQKAYWCPKGGAPAWIEIEFAQEETIDKIVVVSVYSSFFDQPVNVELKSYDVYYWDGNQWASLVSVEDNHEVKNTHSIPPVTTKKIKVDLKSGSGIAEIEAWRKR